MMQLPVSIGYSPFGFFEFLFSSCVLTHDLIYATLISMCMCFALEFKRSRCFASSSESRIANGISAHVLTYSGIRHMYKYICTLRLDSSSSSKPELPIKSAQRVP